MCNPVAWMAAGTAMQYAAQRDAASKAKKQIGVGEDRNDAYNRDIVQSVTSNAQQYDPSVRQENIKQAQDKAVINLSDYLNRSRPAEMETSQGRVSDVYTTDRARRVIDTANKSNVVARLMAKIQGVNDLQLNESVNNADNATKVGMLANHRGNMARANAIDVQQAGTPNPGVMLAGAMMRGYGQGKLAS